MSASAFEVVDPGLQTTVQSYPGRVGLTADGYFPAGPMDQRTFRAANALVGNPASAAGLEIPKLALTLVALTDIQIAVCAPDGVTVRVDSATVPTWQTVLVPVGATVRVDGSGAVGYRSYLAVRGGIDVRPVYGSTTTSLIAGIGGIEGRALVRGDVISAVPASSTTPRRLPEALRPRFTTDWELEIVAGPHCYPDYLTETDWAELVGTTWRVDLNSDRVATRLHPHRFAWAHPEVTVAGGHPSNVLDQAYPVGALLATGDVLTIIGMEGNTSGGFAVVATVPRCALWKVGQVRPGRDTIRFREVTYAEALALDERLEFELDPRRLGAVR
ncbi:urea amidolyase [Gordonia sp. TBRC 11910]|uniref:Urea amidolyase n=1 Tax=Gordonia asplenii TaxID=2725283 RepID=A0A848L614_9ACTN|nr:biotin-dependent carboxyltransferase family protein [Gordonia asplenii]NMO04103.1 urea amidolyase [Gordonia asplenii]